MPRGWRVFAHIRGENGGRFLADHDPPEPFETWPEGKFIQYTTTVTAPVSDPSGVYTIYFGLYRDRARMPLSSDVVEVVPRDEAIIGTIQLR
jgi:hypothetical protein